jgi:hypothetical protein
LSTSGCPVSGVVSIRGDRTRWAGTDRFLRGVLLGLLNGMNGNLETMLELVFDPTQSRGSIARILQDGEMEDSCLAIRRL